MVKMVRYTVCLLLFIWGVLFSAHAQDYLVSTSDKEILVPRKEIKDRGFDQPGGKFGSEYKAESENLCYSGRNLSVMTLRNMLIRRNGFIRKRY